MMLSRSSELKRVTFDRASERATALVGLSRHAARATDTFLRGEHAATRQSFTTPPI